MDDEALRVAKDCISTSQIPTSLSRRMGSIRARLPPGDLDSGIELTELKKIPKQLSLEGSLVTSGKADIETSIPTSDSTRSLSELANESISVENKPREKRNMKNAELIDYVFCVGIMLEVLSYREILITFTIKS